MSNDFNAVWRRLQMTLAGGETIRNWSPIRAYTGNQFTVVGTEANAILVRSNRTGNERRVTKRDFESVFSHLPDLEAGAIGRHELGQLTQSRNTSYILSLINWARNNMA